MEELRKFIAGLTTEKLEDLYKDYYQLLLAPLNNQEHNPAVLMEQFDCDPAQAKVCGQWVTIELIRRYQRNGISPQRTSFLTRVK